MAASRSRANAWVWTIGALAGLAWGLIAVVFASVGPSQLVPRFFYSYHVEHCAAFYVLTILAVVGLPRVGLFHIGMSLIVMALVLASVRMVIPNHRLSDAEDLAADIVGVLGAMAPIVAGRFRRIFAQTQRAETDTR